MYYGKIKFYDSRVNHFGYITSILSKNGFEKRNLRIQPESLFCKERDLFDNTEVIFNIDIQDGKWTPTNVKLLTMMTEEEQQELAFFFSGVKLETYVLSLINKKITLSASLFKFVCEKIFANSKVDYPFNGFEILTRIGDDNQVLKYISLVKNQSENVKFNFLKKYPQNVLTIIEDWDYSSGRWIKELLEIIKSNNLKIDDSNKFINNFIQNLKSFNLENKLLFLSVFDSKKYLTRIFSEIDPVQLSNADSVINLVNSIFTYEDRILMLEKILTLYLQDYKNYSFYSISKLLKTVITYHNQTDHIRKIPDILWEMNLTTSEDFCNACDLIGLTEDDKLFDRLNIKYEFVKEQFNDSQKLEIIKGAKNKLLQSALTSWSNDTFDIDLKLLSLTLLDEKYLVFQNIFVNQITRKIDLKIERFSKTFSGVQDIKLILDYTVKFSDYALLSKLITNILFEQKNLFLKCLNNLNNKEINDLIRLMLRQICDGTLLADVKVLYFFLKDNYIPELEVFRAVIENHKLFVQPLIIQKLSLMLHIGHTNESIIKNILTSNTWTDISSSILASFIIAKPSIKNEALDVLSNAYKNHFIIFNKFSASEEKVEDFFSIASISKKCDGRKKYDKQDWQRESIQRTYVNRDIFREIERLNIFCEGRYWKTVNYWDNKTKVEFESKLYWCRGDVCEKLNTVANLDLDFFDWTLVEISKIFGLSIDSLVFSIIGGWVNRMNEISHRLYCRKCNSILRALPFDPKQLGYYGTPLFVCVNENCENINIRIRFTHCLNGKCNGLLDSRDLPTCSNGWLICECGTCCPSHSQIDYQPIIVD